MKYLFAAIFAGIMGTANVIASQATFPTEIDEAEDRPSISSTITMPDQKFSCKTPHSGKASFIQVDENSKETDKKDDESCCCIIM